MQPLEVKIVTNINVILQLLFSFRRKELNDKKIDCSCERCSDGSEAETGFVIPMMAMLMATLVLLMDIVIRSD